MPITNATHKGTIGGVDHYEFTDTRGRVHKEKWKHGPAIVPATWMVAERQPEVDALLVLAEIDEQFAQAQRGNTPDKVPPDEQPQADFDRRLIAKLMQDTSIETTIAALDFWTAHQARSGNNNPQRAAALGVPTAEYAEADSRFGVAQGIAGGVNTWKSETWDGIPSEAWQ